MNAEREECPSVDRLMLVLQSEDSTDEAVEHHLESCAECLRLLDELSASEKWQRLLPTERSASSFAKASENTDAVRRDATDAFDATSTDIFPKIDGYRIERLIGTGGMGRVFQAHQERVNRRVAIKVLRPDNLHPERRLRFRIEVEAAGRLRHPHIVQVYESGDAHGTPYVVQELLQAGSLAGRMTSVPFSPDDAVTLLQVVTSAVVHAHEQGVLHRDIKPNNILFADESFESARLADFGLAKLLDATSDLTGTEDIIGTPAYMSPEQSAGDASSIGPTTDVFSLGIVLYELLTGVAPFRAETPVETLRLIQQHDPVAPRKLQPSIARDLSTVCLKCLEKNCADRYPTAKELATDLEHLRNGRSILARPPSLIARAWKLAKRRPGLTALSTGLCAAIVFLLVIWARFTSELQTQTSIAQEKTKTANEALARETDARVATQEMLAFITEDLFNSVTVERDGIDAKVVDVLATANEKLNNQFSDRPTVELKLRQTIGNLYWDMGETRRALPHVERAIELFRGLSADEVDSVNWSETQLLLARCMEKAGRKKEARQLVAELLSGHIAPLRSELRFNVVMTDLDLRRNTISPEQMKLQLESMLRKARSELEPDHPVPNLIRSMIASNLHEMGKRQEALAMRREILQDIRRIQGPEHPRTLEAAGNLAARLAQQEEYEEARELQEWCLETKLKVMGPDNNSTIVQYHNLSMLCWRMGDHFEATRLLKIAIDGRTRLWGSSDSRPLESLHQIGRMYLIMQEYEAAERIYDQRVAPEIATRRNTGQWIDLLSVYARVKAFSGKTEEAEDFVSMARDLSADKTISNAIRLKFLSESEKIVADSLKRTSPGKTVNEPLQE